MVGKPGRRVLRQGLPVLQQAHQPLFTIVNGENSSGGIGITQETAQEIFSAGADAITLGNHAFRKPEVLSFLDRDERIVRPHNVQRGAPGRGLLYLEKGDVRLAVMNFCGRVHMDPYGDPFAEIDELLATVDTPHRMVDFHAEATSEKIAMAWHLEGRVSAVLGTHTHVTTADEVILPGGTAYITDVGMTGPWPSVLGMDREVILQRFRSSIHRRFVVAEEPGVISGVVVSVIKATGRAESIERVRFGENH